MKKGKLNNNLISKLAMGFLKDIGTNRCFYCDSLTECREHIIPASYFTVRQKENMILVDSCRLCNSLARDYVPYSCIDKKDWIKERFFQKYEKLLLQRDWDDEDIEELEGSLKSYIRGGEKAKTSDFYKKLEKGHQENLDKLKAQRQEVSQLIDIWNQAQPTKGVDPLIEEARKYKSAEEFVNEKLGLKKQDSYSVRVGKEGSLQQEFNVNAPDVATAKKIAVEDYLQDMRVRGRVVSSVSDKDVVILNAPKNGKDLIDFKIKNQEQQLTSIREKAKNELRIRYDNLCTLNFYGKDKENVKSFDYKIMLILTGKLE